MSDHQGRTPRLAQAPLRTAAVLAVAALALLGLAATASAKNGTTWLCKPGLKPDPCLENREANLVTFNGTTREETITSPSIKGITTRLSSSAIMR